MSYDQDFFQRYENYLQEKWVRETHDIMFRTFRKLFPVQNVIEFGCGQCCEFRRFGKTDSWFGFDLEPPKDAVTYACDYTKLTKLDILKLVPFSADGFVSIFSTECCLSRTEKYAFYRRLFREHDFKAGLVSGFYYENKVKEEQVGETGGISSYQTVEDQRDFMCDEFIEWRLCVRMPSEMFGDDVVEVWKILINPKYD